MKINYKIIFVTIGMLVAQIHCKEKDDPCLLSVELEESPIIIKGRVELIAQVDDGLEPYTYKWTGGTVKINENNPERYVDPFETVSLEVMDKLGCVVTKSYTNDICTGSNLSVSVSSFTDAQLNVTLRAVVTGGFTPYSFTWSTGEHGDSIIVPQPGIYSVTVTDDFGCTKSGSFDVACVTGCEGCNGDTTITDNEGNIYNIVTIGNQCWMAENLRVSAGIAEVADSLQWKNIYDNGLQTPAWCYYQNNPANGATYGKLYNWYAVATGSLCPVGWHIPTHDEWQNLVEYLGGDAVAGGALKDTTGWNAPNMGATNSSGFSALPGGFRNASYGIFTDAGITGYYWSSTEQNNLTSNAYHRYLRTFDSRADWLTYSKWAGFSCRCVKD